jgi:addiction module RelB/DinJ family antitoxin
MATTPKKKNMTVTINVKTDKKTKEEAQRMAADLGFSLSGVINASLKQFVRTGEVYVSLRVIPAKLELEWIKEMEEAKKTEKGYTNAEEFMKDLFK